MANKSLVVVESAAKAKTIEKFLGRGYAVRACLGHVRDLPKSKLGVDVDHDFEPQYVESSDRKDVVKRLRAEAKGADSILIATDPDREGEAIAWHLVSALKLDRQPVSRIEFHEVTKDAVLRALKSPREIDQKRVDAQQARRVLDRLVGYKISPLLWRKVRPGLSAGRVQSVAVRLVVDREREREAFVTREYWSLDAELARSAQETATFKAGLIERDREKLELASQAETDNVVRDLDGATYTVREVRTREQQRNPAAPFITSTLQQEASRKLNFTARRTMALAQQLYEGIDIGGETVGLITYMRTDSVQVAEQAITEVRRYIAEKNGSSFVPERPRVHRTRSRLAQEAHEAIRPTSVYREPSQLRGFLEPAQLRLYDLIWKRFLASQMASAILDQTSVDIDAARGGAPTYTFRATGSVLKFRGFLEVYREGRDDDEVDDDERQRLPSLEANHQLDLRGLLPEQHFTQPPPRYTEATLVKALEERGIGRPSTYAPILSTIQDRGYVTREDKRFKPTDVGELVNDLLVGNFPEIVDLDFTANMEERLDDIATGERPWVPVLREFYTPFEATIEKAQAEIEHVNKSAEVTDVMCDKCGKPMAIKLGRFGRFLSCTGFPDCRNARPLNGDPAEPELSDETCTECGKQMVVRSGRFGKFLACSGYPECKATRPIQTKLGVACPKCNSDLVERRSRGGRVFYGCSAYPACDWVSWNRPLPEPCETCGGLRLQMGADRVHCLGCDGELPQRRSSRAADGESSPRGRTAAARVRTVATSKAKKPASGKSSARSTTAKSTDTSRRRKAS